MQYRTLLRIKFVEITGIIGIIITAVIGLMALDGETLRNLSRCGSGNTSCTIIFDFMVAIGSLLVLWTIIYLFALGLDLYSSRRAKEAQLVAEQIEQAKIAKEESKIMTLSVEPLQNDLLDLRIHNNEDGKIVLNQAAIGHRDGIPEKEDPPWTLISNIANVPLEKGESVTTRFLSESLKQTNFFVFGQGGSGDPTHTIYGRGIHKFYLRVIYDSVEKRTNGLLKWFDVTVNYIGPSQFQIDIKHADRKT